MGQRLLKKILMRNMKKPRTIRAFATVEGNNPKIDVFDIFKDKDIAMAKGEKLCVVEIKFITYIKK